MAGIALLSSFRCMAQKLSTGLPATLIQYWPSMASPFCSKIASQLSTARSGEEPGLLLTYVPVHAIPLQNWKWGSDQIEKKQRRDRWQSDKRKDNRHANC
jgi:hypothetical protein